MRLRLAIVLAGVIVTLGCPGPEQGPVQISIPKIQQAQALAAGKDGRARIRVAVGERSNRQWMTDPEQTEKFSCAAGFFDLPSRNFKCWLIEYWARWTISPIDAPWEIDLSIDLSEIGMDVCDAWRLVKVNGWNKPFYSWSLFQPLNPHYKHPVFIFSAADKHIVVDAVTSEITIEKF